MPSKNDRHFIVLVKVANHLPTHPYPPAEAGQALLGGEALVYGLTQRMSCRRRLYFVYTL